MKIPLNPDIGTRDGTLTKDSVCTNLVAGQRRPGLGFVPVTGTAIATGVGRGLVMNKAEPIAISGNVLYQTGLIYLIGPPPSLIPVNPIDLTSYIGANTCPVDLMLVTYTGKSYLIVKGFGLDLVLITPVSSNSPTVTVPATTPGGVTGLVMLDQTLYVMDTHGNIRGSNLGDITTWNALNTIAIDLSGVNDLPQAIAKVQSYLVAFSVYSTQFFYDNGNPAPGSPLSPAPSLQVPIGCANPFSVAYFSAGLFFLSMTVDGKLGVHVVGGTSVNKISTDAIDKLLELNYTNIYQDLYATAPKVLSGVSLMNGREVYMLYLKAVGVTLVYDIVAKSWGRLTKVTAQSTVNGIPTFTEGVFDSVLSALFSSYGYVQNASTAKIEQIKNGVSGGDVTTGFPVVARVVTQPFFDPETNGRLRVAATEVLGDKVSEVAYLAYTDDDYQTWSNYGEVDLSNVRSRTVRDGSTHRRAYRLQYSGNSLARFHDLLLDIPERGDK